MKSDQDALTIIDYLLNNGWTQYGSVEPYRVLVGEGNVSVVLGQGRRRFRRNDWWVSVGIKTTNFYQIGEVEYHRRDPYGDRYIEKGIGAVNLTGFPTKDFGKIRKHAGKLQ